MYQYKLTPGYYASKAMSAATLEEYLDANVGMVGLLSRHFQFNMQLINDMWKRIFH